MNRKLAVTLGAAALCAAAGLGVAEYDLNRMEEPAPVAGVVQGIPKEDPSPASRKEPSAAPSAEPAGQPDQPVYWLKNSEGRLGVFVEDATNPEMVLDVYLSSLPQADREALEAGVRAGSYAELVSMIEDYIS